MHRRIYPPPVRLLTYFFIYKPIKMFLWSAEWLSMLVGQYHTSLSLSGGSSFQVTFCHRIPLQVGQEQFILWSMQEYLHISVGNIGSLYKLDDTWWWWHSYLGFHDRDERVHYKSFWVLELLRNHIWLYEEPQDSTYKNHERRHSTTPSIWLIHWSPWGSRSTQL